MRQLATIRTVAEVRPIEGADQIEVAQIDGWQCVVSKDYGLQPGSKVLYLEVDSMLPTTDDRFAFMASRGASTNGDGSQGYRLRTIKLRKTLSQGLALPISVFPELEGRTEDLADLLGIKKYEPPIPAQLAGVMRGNFPSFIPKTDQERIQNVPHMLNEPGQFEVTQKLDGSSMTVYWNNGDFGVCSRNIDLEESEGNTYWKVANRLGLRAILTTIGLNIAIQGELMGPNVQGNPAALADHHMFVFDIWLIDEQRYASRDERHGLLDAMDAQTAGVCRIDEAPCLGFKHMDRFPTMGSILDYADSIIDCLNPSNPNPEGVVFKAIDGSKSFKVISNKYLLRSKQ